MKKLLSLSLVASSFLLADTNIEQLKVQMDKQQLVIEQLMKKIEQLENKEVAHKEEYLPKIKLNTQDETKLVENEHKDENIQTFSQSSYLPNISLITDFSYVSRSKSDDVVAHLEVPGVAHGLLGSHSHGESSHATYNAKNGLNFNYAELGMSKEIDPYFNMNATFHLSEYGFEIEEAYITSTLLGNGLQAKGGKFLSSFGYLNDKHHHIWSFSDMPLVYESFLGRHGINEIGLQFQWLAPTSNYLMFGAEILQGNNEMMFGTDSIFGDDIETPIAKGSSAPSLFVAYVKSSFDIEDTTVLAGLSYAKGSSRIDHSTDAEAPHVFSGDSTLYGVDLLVKHYFDSYSYLSWQSELLLRDMSGKQYGLDSDKIVTGTALLDKKQSGFYTQVEYAVNNNWKTALRYDSIFMNDVVKNGVNLNRADSLYKYSAMLEYKTSEFAKFRLQYNRNEALYNEDALKQKINTIILQANFSIGAHGAHSF